ncbi:MAG: hypothetical protein LBQ59_03100 [Candidatus Peribacteria bacterium]|nr:hypothetical protein [Candidatus Peribacteria bacterium]
MISKSGLQNSFVEFGIFEVLYFSLFSLLSNARFVIKIIHSSFNNPLANINANLLSSTFSR